MKNATRQITLVALFLGLLAHPAIAERNLVPSMENTSDVCSDRPDEPDWMRNLPLRDAYQRVLVQDIYRAQNLERIVETGSCTCGARFPDWENAVATFQDTHFGTDRWEMLQASDAYNQRANDSRLEAKAICEAAGNW